MQGRETEMSLHRSSGIGQTSGNLKYGDIVLFYYNDRSGSVAASDNKSGFILADLSG